MLSMAFNDNGELLTGDSNGNLMVWLRGNNRPCRTIFNAHESGVFTVCTLKDGTYLTGGGKDRRIVEWDQKFNPTGREAKVWAILAFVHSCLMISITFLSHSTKHMFLFIASRSVWWSASGNDGQGKYDNGGHYKELHYTRNPCTELQFFSDSGIRRCAILLLTLRDSRRVTFLMFYLVSHFPFAIHNDLGTY